MPERHSTPFRRAWPLLAVPTSLAVLAAGLVAATPAGASSPAEPASVSAAAAPAITPKVREVPVPEAKQPRTMRMQTTPDGDHTDGDHGGGTEQGRVVAATGMRPTQPYAMLGVTWAAGNGAEDFEAEVRIRDDEGWSQWQHLHTHVDGPTGDDTVGTAPMWVGEANGVQARVLSPSRAEPRDVEVSLIDPGGTDGGAGTAAASTELAEEDTAMAVPAGHSDERKPAIISRRGWGADESMRERCSNGRYTRTTDVVFVHHTAGSNNYSKSQSKSIVRGIYAYHTRSRGWCDIGYNFLVDKYGQIFEGRSGGVWKPVYGAHTGGYNNNSIGVSLMGNFESVRPTKAMKNATTRIVSWKLSTNYRHPKGNWRINGKRFRNISGHRDAKSTACPGRYVYNWLPTLRNRVDNRIAPYNGRIFQKWKDLGKRGGIAKEPFRGARHGTGGARAEFRGADLLHKAGPGTHEVHGAIRALYRRLGSQRHTLGFPRTDERNAAPKGSRKNRFERGMIYWSKRTGAHEVYGAIFRRYWGLGAAASRLGLPVTGERNAPGGRISKFQGGEIRWNRSTRKTTVRYY